MTEDGQLLLPFDEETKELDLPFFENPKNDNEILLNLQSKYKRGNKKVISQIYTLSVEICKKFISKKAKGNRFIRRLSPDERTEKAIDATNYVVMRLMKKKEWYIKTSFTAYLYLRVIHELYHKRKVDKIVAFVDIDDLYQQLDNECNYL